MENNELRNLIFGLHTRKFGGVGEKLVERILIEDGFIVDKSSNTSYDRKINNKKDEIKCSRVLGKSVLNLDCENIIESLLNHESERTINFKDYKNHEFDSNIQQIKPDYFETLWYGLFFGDVVALFKIEKNQILEDQNVSYSNKQHRGNEGEGQFHITNKNIKHHIKTYLVKTLTYDEVYEKLKN